MSHATLPIYDFARDRAVAERIIAANAHNPIRVMGPSDYSAGKAQIPPARKDGVRAKAEKARAALAVECAKYLREHGRCLTAQLSRATGATHRAVALACDEVPGIRSEALVVKTSRKKVWWLPETVHSVRIEVLVKVKPQYIATIRG